MAELIEVKRLLGKPLSKQLVEFASSLPDGKAVPLLDVIDELGYTLSPAIQAAKKAGICFKARLEGSGTGGYKTMIANPKTVKQWLDAQKKLNATG